MILLRNVAALAVTALLTACATFSDDPRARTPGSIIDDEVLENLIASNIRKSDPGFEGSHIVTVCYNGIVLLAGQVATSELKRAAGDVARQVGKARSVHNELEIGGPISYVARSNDSWLTSKVKTRLIADEATDANLFKVVTENGTVYLMGLSTRTQADAAVAAAAQVYGRQKIVKVFEYLD
jgi:osmotically-inducible protein OsmY